MITSARKKLSYAFRRLPVLLPHLLGVPALIGTSYVYQLLPPTASNVVQPYEPMQQNWQHVHWSLVLQNLRRNMQPVDVPHSFHTGEAPGCAPSLLYAICYMLRGEREASGTWSHRAFRQGDGPLRPPEELAAEATKFWAKMQRVAALADANCTPTIHSDAHALDIAASVLAEMVNRYGETAADVLRNLPPDFDLTDKAFRDSPFLPLVVLYAARGSAAEDLRGMATLLYGNGVREHVGSGAPLQKALDGMAPRMVLLSNAAGHYQATEPAWTEQRLIVGGAPPGTSAPESPWAEDGDGLAEGVGEEEYVQPILMRVSS